MSQSKLRTVNNAVEKWCPHCSRWKLLTTAFGKKRGGKNGTKTSSWCRECCVTDTAEWRKRNGRWSSPLCGRTQRIVSNMCRLGTQLRSADIHALYDQQNGKCYYTGIKMVLMSDIKNDPLLMSVDRKDSTLGYTKNNTVLCCLGINHLKGRHSVERMFMTLRVFYNGAKEKRGWD